MKGFRIEVGRAVGASAAKRVPARASRRGSPYSWHVSRGEMRGLKTTFWFSSLGNHVSSRSQRVIAFYFWVPKGQASSGNHQPMENNDRFLKRPIEKNGETEHCQE